MDPRAFLIGGAAALIALGGAASAASGCYVVQGGLHADLYSLPSCDRGIFMCAKVTLKGDLAPGAQFTFTSLGKGNVTDPQAFTYTGYALVSPNGGHFRTEDSGRFELRPLGPSPFHTIGTITGGDGAYAGASGVVQVTGALDFQAQTGDGSYVGVICH